MRLSHALVVVMLLGCGRGDDGLQVSTSAKNNPTATVEPQLAFVAQKLSTDDSVVAVSSLRSGDVLVLRYTSKGCFYSEEIGVTFRHATNTVATIEQSHAGKLEKVGEVTLSEKDVAGLDRFLHRIRQAVPNHLSSTTRTQVDLELQREGKVIATEQFEPNSFYAFRTGEVDIADLLVRLRFPGIALEPK